MFPAEWPFTRSFETAAARTVRHPGLVATSEPYTSKSSALKGAEAIKGNATDARVQDESGDDQAPTATPWVTPDASPGPTAA